MGHMAGDLSLLPSESMDALVVLEMILAVVAGILCFGILYILQHSSWKLSYMRAGCTVNIQGKNVYEAKNIKKYNNIKKYIYNINIKI